MKKINVAILAMATLLGLSGWACQEGDQAPNAPRAPDVRKTIPKATGRATVPNPHEGDPQPSPSPGTRVVTISAGGVEKELWPWELSVHATGVAYSFDDFYVVENAPIIKIEVPNDVEATFTVEVKPARAGSNRGFCWIRSPDAHDGPRYISGGWRAQCYMRLPKK